MNEDDDAVYEKLRAHLDSMPVGCPKTESGVEIRILKQLFTPVEAQFALKLGIIPQPAKRIYRKFKKKGYSLEQVDEILKNMVKKGIIMGGTGKGGNKMYYSIAFIVIGIFEYRVDRWNKQLAEDFQQYLQEGFLEEVIESKPSQLRTIPNKESLKTIEINESIENEKKVIPFDDVEKLIENASNTISLANCVCRQEKDILGEGCDHPKETCLQFGGAAHYYIDNGMARQITKEEALEVLRKAQDIGLVIQPTNTQRPTAICCCCGCSCGILSNARKLEKPAQFFTTNYFAEVSDDLCVGCGTCEDRCPMLAVKLNDENVAEVNLDRCIGCGVCVPKCPSDAIHLIQKDVKIPPKNMLQLYQEIGKIKAQKK
ncbi:MAG: 4Fe-4S dicluster domain-containing protein [Candidatus Lokiarchaeota archaeon]|nr:4Fe-4S dicluster domain-containing protein [Candidatus Lokiarchaeota archaeon]